MWKIPKSGGYPQSLPSVSVEGGCIFPRKWCILKDLTQNLSKETKIDLKYVVGLPPDFCGISRATIVAPVRKGLKKNSGAHSRVATLIQPSFQKKINEASLTFKNCQLLCASKKKIHFFLYNDIKVK